MWAIAVSAQQTSPTTRKTTPAFRVGVDVVSLSVTVTDGVNHFVTDLEPGDFSVFEDGVKQDVTFFNRRQQPIALSLLLDTSASMEEHLPMLQVAATNFVKRLETSDIAQVIDFDSRVEIRQAFTVQPVRPRVRDPADGRRWIDVVVQRDLHRAPGACERFGRSPNRTCAVRRSSCSRMVRTHRASCRSTRCSISPSAPRRPSTRSRSAVLTLQAKGFREAEFVLRTLARETGGRAFFPMKIDDLAGVYAQIADELASRYTLGYTSSNPKRDGAWRRLAVQISRPSNRARTKNGYYAPTMR